MVAKTPGEVVKNIVGAHGDSVVEQTTKKTLHSKTQAVTSEQIVKNIV